MVLLRTAVCLASERAPARLWVLLRVLHSQTLLPEEADSFSGPTRRRTEEARKWLEQEFSFRPQDLRMAPADKLPDLDSSALQRIQALMHDAMFIKDTDSAAATVQELCQKYSRLPMPSRQEALINIATDFGINRENASSKARYFLDVVLKQQSSPDEAQSGALVRAEQELRAVLTPPYVRLFEAVNAQPGGLKFLSDLRGDLLSTIRDHNEPALRSMNDVLTGLLANWLSPACLELRRITWDSPASLISKIIAHEKVHPFENIEDVRRRLGRRRRLFAYFHPSMPGEPLIFLQLALVPEMAADMKVVMEDVCEEREATAAIFYSIDATQPGLGGIDLGSFLIKRVVQTLKAELPNIQTFATLSPLPGFLRWLLPKLALHARAGLEQALAPSFQEALLHHEEVHSILAALAPRRLTTTHTSREALQSDACAALRAFLVDPAAGWLQCAQTKEALKGPLMRLAARYLLQEKKRGRCLDPVANFHIRNGASMERLNWLADDSSLRLQESAGLMVNYQYRMADIEDNNKAYIDLKTIPASMQFHNLLQSSRGGVSTQSSL